MDIKCPSCGAENWLENQSRCFHCSAVLRRCVDCAHYDRSHRSCQSLDTDISIDEAEHPSLLSLSTNCAAYRYLRAASP